MVAVAAIVDQFLDRTLLFALPLGLLVMIGTGVGTPALTGNIPLRRWTVALLVIAALGIGIGLVTMGDAESGDLELPPRAAAPGGPLIWPT